LFNKLKCLFILHRRQGIKNNNWLL